MRKLTQKEASARTVPRVRDLRRGCRMERRRATAIYFKATSAGRERGDAANVDAMEVGLRIVS